MPPGSSTSIATTSSPSRSEMPRTPYAVRPIGRTSPSGKRMAMPSRVPMKISPLAVGELHGDDRVAFLDAHRDDAAGARVAEGTTARSS